MKSNPKQMTPLVVSVVELLIRHMWVSGPTKQCIFRLWVTPPSAILPSVYVANPEYETMEHDISFTQSKIRNHSRYSQQGSKHPRRCECKHEKTRGCDGEECLTASQRTLS
ncbi:hypothetical protein KC19_10G118100 [Ceratodon purpureus]|uniref:Uncharacterized protein n=1 Tax=Ceratodon purpureus TaxID=3225 RepID=A0A8T0GMZ8_CERPU|nr:hypothetical protein KC19_10G118100 [Ceratodon purpureus]